MDQNNDLSTIENLSGLSSKRTLEANQAVSDIDISNENL